jgi:ABC-2 type transport system ATP-binding protein
MDEADKLCHRIAIMDHGKILVNDTSVGLKKMIPDGTALEVRAYAPAEKRQPIAAALQAIAGVVKVDTFDGDAEFLTYRVTYRTQADSADTLIGPVAQAVLSTGAEVRDLSVKQPSLEEVFISLTGRHLR